MSMHQFETTPNGMQPPPRPGMSTRAKVLMWLGIVFVTLLVLCCGGVILVGYLMHSYVAKAISKDPVTIAAVTDQITRIEIPDGLQPQFSLDMEIPFSGERFMVGVMYADEGSESALLLMAMGGAFGSQDQARMQQSFDQALRQQGMQEQEGLAIEQSYQKQTEIRGQPATFTIAKGRGTESQTPRIQDTGSFQGKTGLVMLIFNADAEKFSEQQVVEMIDSIQ